VGTAQEQFKAMLRDVIAPALRAEGFKGSGTEYSLNDSRSFATVGFQSSSYSTAELMKFTVNLKVTLKTDWAAAKEEFSWIKSATPRPNISYSGVREWFCRIGTLMPDANDRWWDLGANDDLATVAKEVLTALRTWGIPELIRQRDQLSGPDLFGA
jgi:hypothetical protein